MSFRKFANKFRGMSAQKVEDLKKYGLHIHLNSVLAERVASLGELCSYIRRGRGLEERTGKVFEISLEDRVNYVDTIIRQVAVPWGRGGSKGSFARLMMHWELLLKQWDDLVNMREEDPNRKRILNIDKLIDHAGKREVIPFGLMIVDVSFIDIDVAPQDIAIIQTMAPMGMSSTPQAREGSMNLSEIAQMAKKKKGMINQQEVLDVQQ